MILSKAHAGPAIVGLLMLLAATLGAGCVSPQDAQDAEPARTTDEPADQERVEAEERAELVDLLRAELAYMSEQEPASVRVASIAFLQPQTLPALAQTLDSYSDLEIRGYWAQRPLQLATLSFLDRGDDPFTLERIEADLADQSHYEDLLEALRALCETSCTDDLRQQEQELLQQLESPGDPVIIGIALRGELSRLNDFADDITTVFSVELEGSAGKVRGPLLAPDTRPQKWFP